MVGLSLVQPGHNRLEVIAGKIEAAHQRIVDNVREWADATLELAAALRAARDNMPENIAFSQWLRDRKLDFYNKNDRAALIGLASDPALAREVLSQSPTRCYQNIWREHWRRFPTRRNTAASHGNSNRMSPPMNGTDVEIVEVVEKARTPPRGNKVAVPEGHSSLLSAARAGLQIEKDGGDREKAQTESRLAKQTYHVLRDLLLLMERDDLTQADSAIVESARELVENTQRVQKAAALIKPISSKVWGHKGNRHKSDKKRSEAFSGSISFVHATCTATAEIELPHLGEDQKRAAMTAVKEAINSLKELFVRIRRS